MSDIADQILNSFKAINETWQAGYDEGRKPVKSCAGIIRELCNVLDDLAPDSGPDRNEVEGLIKRAGIILCGIERG